MIKFKAREMKDRGYSLHLEGNGGEEALIIVTAWGQDFRTKLVIVSAQCDGGVNVLHHGQTRVNLANVLTTCGNVIKKWARTGIKPTEPEETELVKQERKVQKRLVKLWDRP